MLSSSCSSLWEGKDSWPQAEREVQWKLWLCLHLFFKVYWRKKGQASSWILEAWGITPPVKSVCLFQVSMREWLENKWMENDQGWWVPGIPDYSRVYLSALSSLLGKRTDAQKSESLAEGFMESALVLNQLRKGGLSTLPSWLWGIMNRKALCRMQRTVQEGKRELVLFTEECGKHLIYFMCHSS